VGHFELEELLDDPLCFVDGQGVGVPALEFVGDGGSESPAEGSTEEPVSDEEECSNLPGVHNV